jgi:hypothetical protein
MSTEADWPLTVNETMKTSSWKKLAGIVIAEAILFPGLEEV